MRPWTLLFLAACTTGPGPTVHDTPITHAGDGWLFAQRINRIDLTLSEEARLVLDAERQYGRARAWVRAEATLDGEEAGTIGVRLRGRSGSFEPWDLKPKLKLDFNRYQDERFHGLEALALNNMVRDCSYLREALAWRAFEAAGVPGSRTGWAQLFIDGEDRGLYLVVEAHDDRWLKRTFDDHEGTLYDGSYAYRGWIPHLLDLGRDQESLFDQDEGPELDFADLREVSDALHASQAQGERTLPLPEAIDWEGVHRMWATSQWLGHWDGYYRGQNNYHLYFEPDRPMVMAPWDLDLTFDANSRSPQTWRNPRGALATLCMKDAACQQRHAEIARETAQRLDAIDWQGTMDDLSALTEVGASGDPRGHCPAGELLDQREALGLWLDEASERLRTTWADPLLTR